MSSSASSANIVYLKHGTRHFASDLLYIKYEESILANALLPTFISSINTESLIYEYIFGEQNKDNVYSFASQDKYFIAT